MRACKTLGSERQTELTIHHGRHSFVSHALKRRTLAEVRDDAGHANISTTSIYAHVATSDNGEVGDLFDFEAQGDGPAKTATLPRDRRNTPK